MQQSDRTKRYTGREERKQTQDTLSTAVVARHKESGGPMEERREGSPPRNGRRDDDREVLDTLRGLRDGQQQVSGVLQWLENTLQQLNLARRQPQDQDDDRSIAGSRRVQRASSRTTDKPTQPTFLREERAVEENVEDVEEPTFADAYMAAHDEWQLLTPEARGLMHFDHFVQTRMDY